MQYNFVMDKNTELRQQDLLNMLNEILRKISKATYLHVSKKYLE